MKKTKIQENSIKTAVVYTRVSTEEQAKQDLSLPYQENRCKEYASREGFVVLKAFEEYGRSGTNMKRPELLAMLNFCVENKVNAVIIHKIDRLARNNQDFWTIFNLLKDNGIKLRSVSENIDDTPSSTFILGIMSTQAQYYSENLSQEVKKGMGEKAERGIWPSNAKLGYENYGKKHDRKIRILPEIAKFVKEAFELFATGNYSESALTEVMQNKGMTHNDGRKITRPAIEVMLRNRFYVGEFEWSGNLHKGTHEPLISKDLFSVVQDIINSRSECSSRERKNNFMLRGIAVCTCGRVLTGDIKVKKYKTRPDKEYIYFCCKNLSKYKTCKRVYIKMEELEELVANLFKDFEFSKEIREEIIDAAKEVIEELRSDDSEQRKLINQVISKNESRMKNLEDDRLDRVITPEDFLPIYNRLKEENAKAHQKLLDLNENHFDTVKNLDQILRMSENIHQTYLEASPELKRKYIMLFIKKLVVEDKQIKQVVYTPAMESLIRIREVRIREDWWARLDSN